MSEKKYTTIQQHEPLRVPANWGGQEKKLIVQLEEILDDIYRRFGRLRLEDLRPDLRKTIIESTEGFSSLEQTVEGFRAVVEDANGNASLALQTASSFSERITDAQGNASEALQTASSFSERITDAEGNASEALQTANSFSERITDAQGNASEALQTVNGFENRVEDVEQNSAEAVLRANEAYLKVEAIEGQADYVQYATPTGDIETGDTWTQVAAPPTTWAEARDKNWSNTKMWGELYYNNVRFFVWDGKQWVPLVDAEEQRRVLTEVQVKADGAMLKVEELAGTTPTVVRSTSAAVDLDGFHLYTGGTFDVESDNFNIDKDGNVKIKGYIEAMSGNIGGWVVAENNLHSGSGTNHVRLSTENGKPAIWAGSENADTAPFKVNKDGSMKAESGSIGGWNIAPGNLSSGSGTKHVRLSTEDATYAIWAGAEAGASAPFRVTRDGKVYLTKLYVTDEDGNAQPNPVNLSGNFWKMDKAYSSNVVSAKATNNSDGTTTITFSTRGGEEFNVNFKKADYSKLELRQSDPQGRDVFVYDPSRHTYNVQKTVQAYDNNTYIGKYETINETSGTEAYDDGFSDVTVDGIARQAADSYTGGTDHGTNVYVRATASNGAIRTETLRVSGEAAYDAGYKAGYAAAKAAITISGAITSIRNTAANYFHATGTATVYLDGEAVKTASIYGGQNINVGQ